MLLRAIMLGMNHSINICYIDTKQNWFDFNNRSYFIDEEAVCQVMEKDQRIKNTVELIYYEGNPLPDRSKLTVEDTAFQHLLELTSRSVNNPAKSFWAWIRGR
jgi:hypothetical protein